MERTGDPRAPNTTGTGKRARSRLLMPGSAMVIVSTALSACYTHVPVHASALAPRQEVRVWLNSDGEASVAPLLGGRVKSVDGRVVSTSASGLSLEVPVAVRQAGFHSEVLHQEILLPSSQVVMLQRRQLDRARTAGALTAAGVVVAAAAWAALTGWSGASSDQPRDDSPPQARIPLFAVPLP